MSSSRTEHQNFGGASDNPNSCSQKFAVEEFRPFLRLPTELRLKVWHCALPEARVVEVEWHGQWWAPLESKQPTSGLLGANHESREVILKHWLPLCRYVTTEYRNEQLELNGNVPLAIPDYYINPNAEMSSYQICYFNPAIDTLYIGPSSAGQFNHLFVQRYGDDDNTKYGTYNGDSIDALARINGMSKLRFLAVSSSEWEYYGDSLGTGPQGRTDIELLSQFSSLERFDIGEQDGEWMVFNMEADAACMTRGRLNGHPMEITFREIGRNNEVAVAAMTGYFTANKKQFIRWNGQQSKDWKVSFGVVLILRNGETYLARWGRGMGYHESSLAMRIGQ